MEKEYEPIESPRFALGEALLRMAARRFPNKPVGEKLRLMLSAVMKAFSSAESKGSVCVRPDDVVRTLERHLSESAPDGTDCSAYARLLYEEGLNDLRQLELLSAPDAGIRAPFLYDSVEEETDGARIYVSRYYLEERRLAEDLLRLTEYGVGEVPEEVTGKIQELSEKLGLGTDQKKALEAAVSGRFTVISGGPGTGKTTTVVMILECLLAKRSSEDPLRVCLAAPTGKATGRMNQSIDNLTSGEFGRHFRLVKSAEHVSIEARTIHKWLETPTRSGIKPSEDSPFDADLFIIDEASMVDVHLAARFFKCIDAEKTRVIILGDKHQLAAVGPGAVFADISDKEGALAAYAVELKESRRFDENSVISRLAHAINHDNSENSEKEDTADKVKRLLREDSTLEALVDDIKNGDLSGRTQNYRVAWNDSPYDENLGFSIEAKTWLDALLGSYIRDLTNYLRHYEEDGTIAREAFRRLWSTMESFRPLCAQRRGPESVEAVNAYACDTVRAALRREGLPDKSDSRSFWPGRLVIVRRNDSMLGVYNGDVGIVLPVLRDGECHMLTFFSDSESGGDEKTVPPSLLPEHDTAFAMTIHQSQGSEYPHVAVFLPVEEDSGLATRELLYTGVTRTKRTVAIFGSEPVLEKAIRTPTKRVSGLSYRLRG